MVRWQFHFLGKINYLFAFRTYGDPALVWILDWVALNANITLDIYFNSSFASWTSISKEKISYSCLFNNAITQPGTSIYLCPLQVRSERDKFTIYLDVKHFSPDDLSVKVTDDYVEIQGKHGERQVLPSLCHIKTNLRVRFVICYCNKEWGQCRPIILDFLLFSHYF